jgi:hypothetical protein
VAGVDRNRQEDIHTDTYTATTGGFGDFWLEKVAVGSYSLKIEAGAFRAKTIETISTEKNVNLGDIPLSCEAAPTWQVDEKHKGEYFYGREKHGRLRCSKGLESSMWAVRRL